MANEFLSARSAAVNPPPWAIACGVVGAIAALGTGAAMRRAGTAVAGIAITLLLAATAAWVQPQAGEPWLMYALCLCAMVSLAVSGMLDDSRPRIVAGWPQRIEAARARELGFKAESSFDEIVRIHIEEDRGGAFVA